MMFRNSKVGRREFRPSCEGLDVRIVPAVSATFNAGTGALVINIDNNSRTDQNVNIRANIGGVLTINNDTLMTGRVIASSSVRSIIVNGSNLANKIDLARVDSFGFHGFNKPVTIHGNGGNDNILGSQFNDVIRGGNGDDILSGLSGDDEIRGENGNDTLFGGLGKDKFYGGAGQDKAADNKASQGDYIDPTIENKVR